MIQRLQIALAQFVAVACLVGAWLLANEHMSVAAWVVALAAETTLILVARVTYKQASETSGRVLLAVLLPVLGGAVAILPIWGRHMAHLNRGDNSDPYHAHPIAEIGHVH